MGKGSNTATTSTTSSPDPQAAQAYRDLITRAQGIASTPYQAYTGDLTAPVNAQQTAGINNINANAGYASPYISSAADLARTSSGPIDASTIQSYQNPYTQQVVDATTAQMRNEFGQQNAGLTSNAISQGALGGNGVGVARGILQGQQGRTMASTVAGLYDKSYQQALNAAQQQQQTGLAGANALANYGISGQNAALQGANAQLGAGTLEQQTQQANLTAQYNQYMQQQAYPYQQAQWLAGMTTGLGSNLGGTSSGTTTGPAPNSTGQWIGAGLSAASLFLSDREAKEDVEHIGHTNDGQKIYRFRYKGDPSGRVHMGLIAQEVEQEHPDSVGRGLGGLRVVDMEGATDDSVRRADGGAVFGDYDPPGLAGGQQFAQSSPWQMRPNGNGSVSVINIRTGQVIYTGPASGAAAAQASAPRPRASGGGVGAVPWGGAESWIPQMNIHAGQGAPQGRAPSLPDQKGGLDAEKAAKSITGIGKGLGGLDWGGGWDAGLGNLSGDSWGGGSFAGGDAFGGSSASPLAGLSAADYGIGFAAGGSVMDADIDNPESEYNRGLLREIGYDKLRRGEGTRSPDFIPGGEPPPNHDLPVFDENGRMLGNMTSAQGQVPQSAPVMAAEPEEAVPAPGVAGPAGGAGRPPVMAFAPEGPSSYGAMPDAVSQPQRRESGIGLGLISPNAQSGMLAAGLGMLASRSPFLGNVVGEGGLAGLSAYGGAEERDRQAAAEAEKLSREAREKQQSFGLNLRKQDEAERHNRATEAKERSGADRLPPGLRMGPDGKAEVIPGLEEGLSKISAARRPPPGDTLSDEDAQFLADRLAAGDSKALVGLGRGAQGAANLVKVNRMLREKAERGEPINPAARTILANIAQQEGLKAAERTQATIMAKLSVYGRTAFNATDIAERLSEEVPRTQFMPVNKILNAAREKSGDPKIVALGQSLMTLTNEYARAIGGGHGTVHDKEAAEKRLSAAQTHEQLKAVINVMRQEILAEERAMPAARQHIRDIYNPSGSAVHTIGGEHGKSPTGPAAPVAPPIASREVGKVYPTPKGDLRWNGSGWEKP